MNVKRVIPRERAIRDVEEAVDHYSDKAGETVAFGFVGALEDVYRHIARNPAAGSPRHAHELNLAGLRCWRLKRYPYIVFYMDTEDHVDVWRVLHAKRDIPTWMGQDRPF